MAWKLKKTPECGTTTGYDYHTRQLGEAPCDPCREAKRESWRARREVNREKLNENNRKRRTKTPERVAYEAKASLRRADPDRVVGDWSQNLVLETYGSDCYICHEKIDLEAPRRVGTPGWEKGYHIDHVVPISRGGQDSLSNVRPAHAYCNQRKGNKTYEL